VDVDAERRLRTLVLKVESGSIYEEFIHPLEITVSTSLPERGHHFEINARQVETKEIERK